MNKAACMLPLPAGERKPSALSTDRAWIGLDMDNLRYNVDVLRSLLPSHCRLMAVVKGNAYGHGAVSVSKALNAYGINAFCVATVIEGVELREQGIRGEILILGYTHPTQFGLLTQYRLTQTVIDYHYAKALESYGKKITVHVKIDTGMRRLGERSDSLKHILSIFTCKNLIITGIYSQLCVSDGNSPQDRVFTQKQVDAFRRVITHIKGHGFPIPPMHIQSSYGVLNYPELSFDCARTGISLYGMLYNRKDTQEIGAQLRPVLSVKARISAIKTLLAGESVGYGLMFTAQRDMRFAVLTIGYADGIPRCLSCGAGYVLINGQKAPIIGRICMDQMMVDISGIKRVKQGGTAVILGKSGLYEITACDIAEQAGTVTPEILGRLGERLTRYTL